MKRTILVVLAHPDDESFGCGGTLAKYAAEGADVHICIMTDGAAGSVEDGYEDATQNLAAVRALELQEAVSILGATLHHFNYRDSGMRGDPANDHPDAFINADTSEVVAEIVRLMRLYKPQVVITNDQTGGYFHPDHIRCYEVTTAAFYAAADPEQYPEQELPAHQAQRLYYTAMPRWRLTLFSWLLRLRGQDPTAIGRNKDIDLTKLGYPRQNLHVTIDYSPYWQTKMRASAAHASQGGAGMSGLLPLWLQKRLLTSDTYIRAYPPAADGFRDDDLFNGYHT